MTNNTENKVKFQCGHTGRQIDGAFISFWKSTQNKEGYYCRPCAEKLARDRNTAQVNYPEDPC